MCERESLFLLFFRELVIGKSNDERRERETSGKRPVTGKIPTTRGERAIKAAAAAAAVLLMRRTDFSRLSSPASFPPFPSFPRVPSERASESASVDAAS